MELRPLLIDKALQRKIAKIVAYARAHIYIPGETMVPGDVPAQVLKTTFGYRCVFSLTKDPRTGELYRDLSISVSGKGNYANPVAAFTLASLFGLTGYQADSFNPGPDWLINKDVNYEAIRIIQKI